MVKSMEKDKSLVGCHVLATLGDLLVYSENDSSIFQVLIGDKRKKRVDVGLEFNESILRPLVLTIFSVF